MCAQEYCSANSVLTRRNFSEPVSGTSRPVVELPAICVAPASRPDAAAPGALSLAGYRTAPTSQFGLSLIQMIDATNSDGKRHKVP